MTVPVKVKANMDAAAKARAIRQKFIEQAIAIEPRLLNPGKIIWILEKHYQQKLVNKNIPQYMDLLREYVKRESADMREGILKMASEIDPWFLSEANLKDAFYDLELRIDYVDLYLNLNIVEERLIDWAFTRRRMGLLGWNYACPVHAAQGITAQTYREPRLDQMYKKRVPLAWKCEIGGTGCFHRYAWELVLRPQKVQPETVEVPEADLILPMAVVLTTLPSEPVPYDAPYLEVDDHIPVGQPSTMQ